MHASRALIDALQAQRGHRLPQIAFAYGCGIALYFSLPVEPTFAQLLILCVSVCGLSLIGQWRAGDIGGIPIFLAALLLGVVVGSARTYVVTAPVLSWRMYGPVEGRVVKIDRSASHRLRVTLAEPYIPNLSTEKTPRYVRVSFDEDALKFALKPGQRIALTANLSPPAGPTEPGGFDFQRHAWFLQIGAFGYSRAPPVLLEPAADGFSLAGFRHAIGTALTARLPEEISGIVKALTIGDRAGISEEVLEDLRVSNLAHLLAISGLHMGLLAGTVFGALRLVFAFSPVFTFHSHPKKYAALLTLGATTGYLLISGFAVATQRAYVMAAVMLLAVLLDRRAITLRAVALAALILLTLRPESLVSPGFLMSFAATIALVVAFRFLRDTVLWRRVRAKWLREVVSIFVASAVAGLATAPFSAAHFNMIGQYGLLANLLSVPVMAFLVMPGLILTALLMPLGLDWAPLWVVEQGVRWILVVAAFVAELDGARRLIVAPGVGVLGGLSIALCWCVVWQGHLRWLGLAGAIVAIIHWAQTERPTLLISETGALIGMQTAEGRALSRARGEGFVASAWLSADAAPLTQEEAHELYINWDQISAGPWWFTTNLDLCGDAIILLTKDRTAAPPNCRALDQTIFRQTGAIAIYEDGTLTTSKTRQGQRPWVPPGDERALLDIIAD